ncbi:MAG: tetratricopeptide repeat protein [Ardenticatenaceae bacterium]
MNTLPERRQFFEQTARRFVDYYVGYVEAHETDYSALEKEMNNVLAALQSASKWNIQSARVQGISGLTRVNVGVVGFMDARGHWRTARELLRSLPQQDDALMQAITCFKRGVFAFRQAEHDVAEAHFRQSLSLLNGLPDREEVILYRAYGGEFMSQLMMQHDPEVAMDWVQQGLAALQSLESEASTHEQGHLYLRLSTTLGKTGQLVEAREAALKGVALLPPEATAARIGGFTNLGIISRLLGDGAAAMSYLQKAADDAEALGENRRLAALWHNMAIATKHSGHYAQSIEYDQKALKLYQQIGDVAAEGHTYSNLGRTYMLQGNDQSAGSNLRAALERAQTHQLLDLEAFASINLALWHQHQQQFGKAAQLLEPALAICQQLQLARSVSEILYMQAELALKTHQHNKALKLADMSLQTAQQGGYKKEAGISWRIKADILSTLGDTPQALVAYQKSLDILVAQDPYELAKSQLALGRHHLAHQQEESAKRCLEEARLTFNQLGTKREIAATQALLEKACKKPLEL